MHLLAKQFEEIQTVLEDLKRESELETTLIIVEGRKDIKALQKFGIMKNVIHLKGRLLTEICDEAAAFKKIIILTDFDATGQKIATDLQQNLMSRGDTTYYHKLKFYFKKVCKDIESLFRIYQQIQQTRPKKNY